MYRNQKKKICEDPNTLSYIIFTRKKSWWPLGAKKLSSNWGLLYAKRPASQHGSNAANDKLFQVHGTVISK